MLGTTTKELADLALGAPDSRGVYLVPAFGGLAAPWWDPTPRPRLSAFSFGVTRAPFARAALDSIAHQIADVIDAFRTSGAPVERLLVDGGPKRNDQLMQFEADMVGAPVERTSVAELSAVGVAHLAGLTAGLFTLDGLAKMDRDGDPFTPGAASSTTRRRGEARLGTGRRSGARRIRGSARFKIGGRLKRAPGTEASQGLENGKLCRRRPRSDLPIYPNHPIPTKSLGSEKLSKTFACRKPEVSVSFGS